MKDYKILVINPGSTSDEVAFFNGDNEVFHKIVRYNTKQMEDYEGRKITDQFEFRKQFVLNELKEKGIYLNNLDAVIGRGGLLKPISGGVYRVNEKMKNDLKNEVYGSHASNLGALISGSIAMEINKTAYISDSVTVDELLDVTRYSGIPENPRISIFHCLNQRRVGHLIAEKLGKNYNNLSLIIAHMGGGISVGAHLNGKVVDVNNALNGDGPFTPQRSGGVPAGGLVKLCFSGKYTESEINLMIKGKGGMVAYTGTSDMKLLERYATGEKLTDEERAMIKSDITPDKVKVLYDAMAYQIAKEICGLSVIFQGHLDGIILTGGLAYSGLMTDKIKKRVEWLGQIFIVPGGDEMVALKKACERVLNGEEKCKEYI